MEQGNEYSDLTAGAVANSEKFTSLIFALTEPLRVAKERLALLPELFDVDNAVGDQLDKVGVRVGISRQLPSKLTGVYFAFGDVDGVGFGRGVFKGEFDKEDGIVVLPDETYRAVIKAKVLVNHWDGTRETLPMFLGGVLSLFGIDASKLGIHEPKNMHLVLSITKSETPPIVWELFSRRILDIVSAGVGFSIVDQKPWFGFGYDLTTIRGFGNGYFYNWSSINGD